MIFLELEGVTLVLTWDKSLQVTGLGGKREEALRHDELMRRNFECEELYTLSIIISHQHFSDNVACLQNHSQGHTGKVFFPYKTLRFKIY